MSQAIAALSPATVSSCILLELCGMAHGQTLPMQLLPGRGEEYPFQ